jgi:hypothetical protein
MKTKFTILAVLISMIGYSQWTFKTIKSDFDGTFKKAFTETNNSGYLFLEEGFNKESIFFGLRGSYFCEESTHIDIVFKINGQNKKYQLTGSKSSDSTMYFFSDEEELTEEFWNDFKIASSCIIRVNQEYCRDDYYSFSMKGSNLALSFFSK